MKALRPPWCRPDAMPYAQAPSAVGVRDGVLVGPTGMTLYTFERYRRQRAIGLQRALRGQLPPLPVGGTQAPADAG